MAPSKRKSKQKQKSKLPFLLVILSFGALYFYWYNSGVELFPAEIKTPTQPQPIVVSHAEPVQPATSTPSDAAAIVTEVDETNEPALPSEELMEQEWEKELFNLIHQLNKENPNEMFEAYLQERKRYKESVEVALAKGLASLNTINTNEGPDQSAETYNHEHQSRLKEILGQHYDVIESKRRDFMESLSNLDPTSVETRGE